MNRDANELVEWYRWAKGVPLDEITLPSHDVAVAALEEWKAMSETTDSAGRELALALMIFHVMRTYHAQIDNEQLRAEITRIRKSVGAAYGQARRVELA